MKRICIIILSVLLGMTFPLNEPRNIAIEIATREDLMKIAEDPDGSYVLIADIDLGSNPWIPIPFGGTFDGAGHTIGNLTVTAPGEDIATTFDGNDKQYETVFGGLFSVARSAEIKDLCLLNAVISVDTDRNCFLGAIAGYASDTVLTNCSVLTRQKLTLSSVNVGLGGLVGFSENCTFTGCSVDAELTFQDVNPDVLCEEFLGGVFSCGYGSVDSCSVRLRGYADVYGYAHNGGVIGMFKLAPGMRRTMFYVQDSIVDAEIYFFEVTRSRRAYCKPIIGEDAYELCRMKRNEEAHYLRKESKQAIPQRAEPCDAPSYSAVITEPTCTDWGFTTYTCDLCGYTYRDDFTLPRHSYSIQSVPPTCTEDGYNVYNCTACGDTFRETIPCSGHMPGTWTVVLEPSAFYPGKEELRCTVCGALLEERTVPALGPTLVQGIHIIENEIILYPGESVALSVMIQPDDATDCTIRFSSSDPSVATVDETGRITAIGEGTAIVTVISTDGNAHSSVMVTVRMHEPEPEQTSWFSWLRCARDD